MTAPGAEWGPDDFTDPPTPGLEGFPPDTHEYDANHPAATADEFTGPPVPGGDGGGGGGVTEVSTPSIDLFRTNMVALHDPLLAARTDLSSINIKAGAFAQATALRDKIGNLDTASSVVAQFDLVVTNLIKTLESVERGAAATVAEYDTTEEQNAVTGQELREFMPDLGLFSDTPGVAGGSPSGGYLDAVNGAASNLGTT